MATITYTQGDNTTSPGTITLDGESKTALSGPPNNGRLDNVGDLVFAEFDSPVARIECIRTGESTMTIRVIEFPGISGTYYYAEDENVVENVPIDFS